MNIETLMEHLKKVDIVKLILSGVGSTEYSSEEIYKALENEIKLAKNLREQRDEYAEMYFKAQKKLIECTDELIVLKKERLMNVVVIKFSRLIIIWFGSYWTIKLAQWALKVI